MSEVYGESGEPSISFRKHIRWQGEEATEPTSTLVLTSSGGQFVDVRVLLPTNFSSNRQLLTAEPNTLKIDWAFSGQASSKKGGHEPRRCTWTHWIDSHKPSGFQDSGEMYNQADGTVLEIGTMENPKTGKVQAYEEVWEDPLPLVVNNKEGEAVCHVIQLDKEGRKGMLIRVGQWVQGLRIDGEADEQKVTVERWHWSPAEELKRDWKMMFKIGDGELPCWYMMGENDRHAVEWPEGQEKWSMVEYELFKPA